MVKTYDFLEFDKDTELIYCSWCRENNFKNVLALGKKYTEAKRITEHCKGGDHEEAVSIQLVKEKKLDQKISH